MKIGNLEIRWARKYYPQITGEEDLGTFLAVPETHTLWRAVHQCINEMETETIEAARARTGNPNLCIAAVGAGEGVAMVRMRLIEKRENAITEAKKLRQKAG